MREREREKKREREREREKKREGERERKERQNETKKKREEGGNINQTRLMSLKRTQIALEARTLPPNTCGVVLYWIG